MRNLIVIAVVLVACCLAQDEPKHQPVKIIDGPVVEMVADTSAQIAWSTNENSGTILHYGTDRDNLNESTGMPWGGITHRVLVKNLQPSTMYYFKAESDDGQGTGTRDQSAVACFQTVAAGQPKLKNANCTPAK